MVLSQRVNLQWRAYEYFSFFNLIRDRENVIMFMYCSRHYAANIEIYILKEAMWSLNKSGKSSIERENYIFPKLNYFREIKSEQFILVRVDYILLIFCISIFNYSINYLTTELFFLVLFFVHVFFHWSCVVFPNC
jgi:hypothetical protein